MLVGREASVSEWKRVVFKNEKGQESRVNQEVD